MDDTPKRRDEIIIMMIILLLLILECCSVDDAHWMFNEDYFKMSAMLIYTLPFPLFSCSIGMREKKSIYCGCISLMKRKRNMIIFDWFKHWINEWMSDVAQSSFERKKEQYYCFWMNTILPTFATKETLKWHRSTRRTNSAASAETSRCLT